MGYGEKDLSNFRVSSLGLAYGLIDDIRLSLEFLPIFTMFRSDERR